MPRLDHREYGLDMEEEVAVEQKEDGQKAQARTVQCPECPFEDKDPAVVGVHLERHRPIGFPSLDKKGRPLHRECTRKCGRYFTRPGELTQEQLSQPFNEFSEYRAHLEICDGSKPIEKPKEEIKMPTPKKRTIPPCPLHPDMSFHSGPSRGQHFRNEHPDWKTDPRLNPALRGTDGSVRGTDGSAGQRMSLPTPPGRAGMKGSDVEPLVVIDVDKVNPVDLSQAVAVSAEKLQELAAFYRLYAQQITARASDIDKQAAELVQNHGK